MRAAAVQLSSTPDRDRNLEAADRLMRAAAAAGAELVVLPGEVAGARHAGADRRGRRAARRHRADLGARHRRASWGSTSSPARSPSASTARSGARTRASTSVPTARIARPTARSTCSTWRSAGARYRESEHEAPGDEPVTSELGERRGPGPDDLLRPALPGAVPHPRDPRRHGHHRPRRVHRDDDARPLGGPAARPGDRGPVLRRRRQPGRRARARASAPAGAR